MSFKLILQYISSHPLEVAAQLEGRHVDEVRDLLKQLPNNSLCSIIGYLSDKYIISIQKLMDEDFIDELCEQQPHVVIRVYECLSESTQERVWRYLPKKIRWKIKFLKTQSSYAISHIMTDEFLSLPAETSIEKTIKLINNYSSTILILYTHNNKNELIGEIPLHELCTAQRHLKLINIHKPIDYTEAPSTTIDKIQDLKIWSYKTTLPVVDHDNHLLGIVSLNMLHEELRRLEYEFKPTIYDGAEKLSDAFYLVISHINSIIIRNIKNG